MSLNFSGNLTIININIMKKIIFFFFTLFSLFAFSQQTDFNYQAIIKGSNGMAISGQSVVMQFSIIYDAANGTVAYQETHTVNTSVDGLVNLVIGSGAPTNQTGDSWGAIDWGKPLFLKEKNVRQFPAATISQGLRIIRRTWAQGQEFTRLCGDLTDVSKREKLSTCWD